jgi:DNA-binding transcriptional ArsR family regulator
MRQDRENAEGSIHNLNEVSLFTQNQTLALRHGEIFARFGIGPQTRAIALVIGEAFECNDAPSDIVRAFMRKKISDEITAAAGNDTAPILGVLLEHAALKGIDLITDNARDCHTHSMSLNLQARFAYHRNMIAEEMDGLAVARIASAIGEPARARMLYSLMDGCARTSTELAVAAEVSPATASAHLNRLKEEGLVKAQAQGKHRYYSLDGPNVAGALESLSVLAGGSRSVFRSTVPSRLRDARTCYDHMAGTIGVSLHDRLHTLGWLEPDTSPGAYRLAGPGGKALAALGIDLDAAQALRRRFACACLDWSERRPHLAGALGAALLKVALQKEWLTKDLDSRALTVTALGRREMGTRFGLVIESAAGGSSK